jgi:hypothetical protein
MGIRVLAYNDSTWQLIGDQSFPDCDFVACTLWCTAWSLSGILRMIAWCRNVTWKMRLVTFTWGEYWCIKTDCLLCLSFIWMLSAQHEDFITYFRMHENVRMHDNGVACLYVCHYTWKIRKISRWCPFLYLRWLLKYIRVVFVSCWINTMITHYGTLCALGVPIMSQIKETQVQHQLGNMNTKQEVVVYSQTCTILGIM